MRANRPAGAALDRFAEDYTAAWCSGDPARVATFFAESGVLTVNDAAPCVGRAAIADSARGFMVAFPDLVVELDGVTESEESVVYHWTLHGHNTGPGGTGRRVRISGTERWHFAADGLVATSVGTFDAMELARQLQHGEGDDRG
jgi:nuclear transport factor 2 (NTF2) superfamily protein